MEQCKQVIITVCNLYSGIEEYYLGQLIIPLKPTILTSSPILARNSDTEVKSVQYSIAWVPCHRNISRLKGSWNIHILKANIHRKTSTLRKMVNTAPNLYCVVTAVNSDIETSSFDQVSCIQTNTYNPIWNETFTIPIALDSNKIKEAFLNSSTPSSKGKDNHEMIDTILQVLNKSNDSHNYRFLPAIQTSGKLSHKQSLNSSEESEIKSVSNFIQSFVSL